jgi:hypothetical protein
MLDYTKMKVGEIKDDLIEKGIYTQEQLDDSGLTGKAQWVALHKGEIEIDLDTDLSELEHIFDDQLDEIEKSLEDIATQTPVMEPTPMDPDIPKYTDPEWQDYVLSHFDKTELLDGKYPNVNGLRRVAELLLGKITFSGPVQTQVSLDPDHPGKAVITYEVVFDWELDDKYNGYVDIERGYPQRTFRSVASSWHGNTDGIYGAFPEAIADSRAEARTLRRALRLSVVTAEELTKKDTAAVMKQVVDRAQTKTSTTGDWEEGGNITDAQVTTIKKMCEKLEIDVTKFINYGKGQYDNIGQITKSTASQMLTQLNKYQSSGEDAIEIPTELRV